MLPHFLLCIFKALRYKVDILEACDETFLFAGNLGIKGLNFGMSRKCMLGGQRMTIKYCLSSQNTRLQRLTALIWAMQGPWLHPQTGLLWLYNLGSSPTKQACCLPQMTQDHLRGFILTLSHRRHPGILIYSVIYLCIVAPTVYLCWSPLRLTHTHHRRAAAFSTRQYLGQRL